MSNKYRGIGRRRRNQLRGCDMKQQYASREDAMRAADAVAARIGRPMRIYRCPHCNGWHMAKDKSR